MIRPKTVRERLLYEYAKLVAGSTVGRGDADRYWRFVAFTYRRLKDGTIAPSELLREDKLLVDSAAVCVYYGASQPLQWDHVVPRSHGGPDTIDNLVRACARCNRCKGDQDLIAWYRRRDEQVPGLALGKYLKLLLERHGELGTLDQAEYPEGTPVKLSLLHLAFKPTTESPPAS